MEFMHFMHGPKWKRIKMEATEKLPKNWEFMSDSFLPELSY